LGVAATSASGLWEDINDGAIGLKHLHSGSAAERGIRAAKLAGLGLRSARRSIEGTKGFLAAMARPGDFAPRESIPDETALREMLLAGLGEHWAIQRNIYKRYPFCLACFEPLEGIRHIVARSARPIDDIRSVTVDIYPPNASLIEKAEPQDQLQAKFSAPFAVALVLAGHDPEDVRLPMEWLADPKVRRWYPATRVRADNDVPRRHARVTVAWGDGAEEAADRPLRNLDEEEVWSRFSSACRHYLGERSVEVEDAVARCTALADTRALPAAIRTALGL
jgi:2-methylcitrate dehydratase PrpD